MSGGAPGPGRGSIVWALTLFESESPFRVPAPARARGNHRSVATLAAGARAPRGVELAVGAKVRPVLLLQDRPLGRLPDLVALKLARLGRLSASARSWTQQSPWLEPESAIERMGVIDDALAHVDRQLALVRARSEALARLEQELVAHRLAIESKRLTGP